jgi:hypothetical protein
MNFIKTSCILLLATLTIVSCSVHSTGISAQRPFINMEWEDMEYVRDVQDTTVQSYLLGVIPIGGTRFRKGSIDGNVINISAFSRKRGMRNAIYNVIQKAPDADFFIPTYQFTKIDRMFLGRKEYVTLRVKAFRIKSKEKGFEATPADTIKQEIEVIPSDTIK